MHDVLMAKMHSEHASLSVDSIHKCVRSCECDSVCFFVSQIRSDSVKSLVVSRCGGLLTVTCHNPCHHNRDSRRSIVNRASNRNLFVRDVACRFVAVRVVACCKLDQAVCATIGDDKRFRVVIKCNRLQVLQNGARGVEDLNHNHKKQQQPAKAAPTPSKASEGQL